MAHRGKPPYLTKDELVTLVEWKVAHGKFRPTLKALALQNSPDDVETITKDAFGRDSHETTLKQLTRLRGVGPATASLLMSVCKPDEIPFFSDELFRWCFFQSSPGGGWDRKIKYTPKEYSDMNKQVAQLRRRLAATGSEAISAVKIEKVAYVLGNESAPEGRAVSDIEPSQAKTKRRASMSVESKHKQAKVKDDMTPTRRLRSTK